MTTTSNETRNLLIDTAERIFSDHCDKALLDSAEQGVFPAALWSALRESGFHELAMPASGVALGDAYAVLRVAARHAAPLPLTEILLANRWRNDSGKLVTIGQIVDGQIVDAPWGRAADLVLGVAADGGSVLALASGGASAGTGVNMAGEARDVVVLPARAEQIDTGESAFELLALGRTVSMAGTLERILALSLQYANEREQFGRSIAKFQAIQHNLAIVAGEVAAAVRAADAATDAIGTDRIGLEIAAAKGRVGEAAGIVAEMAHQIHGAMGYTHEHTLHHFTRRVWAWRDEYGNEGWWQRRLGAHLAVLGADALWDFIATRG